MKINHEINHKKSQCDLSNTGVAFEIYEVNNANYDSARVSNEENLALNFFNNQDIHRVIFSRILNEGDTFKNFRLVCHKAAQLTIKFWQFSGCLVKLYPNNLFSVEDELRNEISVKKFQFSKENKFNHKLLLSCKSDLEQFGNIDLQKTQSITTLAISYLQNNELILFKEILKKINQHPEAFINLKNLQTTEFADFSDCSIPQSIECFESFKGAKSNAKIKIVNICNLENLRSIKINSSSHLKTSNFKLANLTNLKSLTLSDHPFSGITFNRKGCPNLTTIVIKGKEMPFDSSKEIIEIKPYIILIPEVHKMTTTTFTFYTNEQLPIAVLPSFAAFGDIYIEGTYIENNGKDDTPPDTDG